MAIGFSKSGISFPRKERGAVTINIVRVTEDLPGGELGRTVECPACIFLLFWRQIQGGGDGCLFHRQERAVLSGQVRSSFCRPQPCSVPGRHSAKRGHCAEHVFGTTPEPRWPSMAMAGCCEEAGPGTLQRTCKYLFISPFFPFNFMRLLSRT